jgi:hypothetical protein
VTISLKAGIVSPRTDIEINIARQRPDKYVSAATNMYTTIKELLTTPFSIWSMSNYIGKSLLTAAAAA